ncbi:hypothetical protein MAPG_07916 [Magnaporthiopsis poae ATCC 64411]|uniref:Uncharacterized protein n=1 Tax=Magnaporthiopsis poae (strain ATCC 64411 / 73-15) TaxID=644358 RepID=A0A0C4E5Y7_MAGP6|nr:hypothetical protein MAPG_07916 [Magnaporthiopsis poae ATCC 64411]
MQLLSTILLAGTVSAVSSGHILAKRCSPMPDPNVKNGYFPPAPCWHTFTPDCKNHIAPSTEQYVSAARHTAVIMGVSDYCFKDIEEEQAREADGRATWGWTKKHGKLTRVPNTNILVITEMPDDAVKAYQAMAAPQS